MWRSTVSVPVFGGAAFLTLRGSTDLDVLAFACFRLESSDSSVTANSLRDDSISKPSSSSMVTLFPLTETIFPRRSQSIITTFCPAFSAEVFCFGSGSVDLGCGFDDFVALLYTGSVSGMTESPFRDAKSCMMSCFFIF